MLKLKLNFMKQFFQNKDGELSSRRLGIITSLPFTYYEVDNLCDALIKAGRPELAVDVWNSYLIFASLLLGSITADILIKVFEIVKGKNTKEEKNEN